MKQLAIYHLEVCKGTKLTTLASRWNSAVSRLFRAFDSVRAKWKTLPRWTWLTIETASASRTRHGGLSSSLLVAPWDAEGLRIKFPVPVSVIMNQSEGATSPLQTYLSLFWPVWSGFLLGLHSYRGGFRTKSHWKATPLFPTSHERGCYRGFWEAATAVSDL